MNFSLGKRRPTSSTPQVEVFAASSRFIQKRLRVEITPSQYEEKMIVTFFMF